MGSRSPNLHPSHESRHNESPKQSRGIHGSIDAVDEVLRASGSYNNTKKFSCFVTLFPHNTNRFEFNSFETMYQFRKLNATITCLANRFARNRKSPSYKRLAFSLVHPPNLKFEQIHQSGYAKLVVTKALHNLREFRVH